MKSVSAIKAKFNRLNISARNTNLWDDISESIKANVKSKIQLTEREIKVLFVQLDSFNWWLLTNERLILFGNEKVNYINLTDIEKVEPKKMFDGVVSKQECSTLEVYIQGKSIELALEDNTWHAIYNLLKFVISR